MLTCEHDAEIVLPAWIFSLSGLEPCDGNGLLLGNAVLAFPEETSHVAMS